MVFYSQGGLHHVLGCGVLLPSEGLKHECEKVVLFVCSEAVQSLYLCIKSELLQFLRGVYSQVRVYTMN